MIITFAWTTPQFLAGSKTVTRRNWSDRTLVQWQKAWDERRLVHDAYDKSPRSGGQKVGTFTLTARPYRERLGDFPESDLVAEGGLWETVQDYINLQGGDPGKVLAVIRFQNGQEVCDARGIEKYNAKAKFCEVYEKRSDG